MSNIYLKVTFKGKNWRSQNSDFLGLKSFSSGQFSGAPTHEEDIIEFGNFLLLLKNQGSGSKTLCGFSVILTLNFNAKLELVFALTFENAST